MAAEFDFIGTVLPVLLGSGGGAAGATLVIKANMVWHKEKLERHSASFKNAFQAIDDLRKDAIAKHEEQQRDIHRLEVEMHKRFGDRKP